MSADAEFLEVAREHVEAEADARFVRTTADYQEREFGRGADFWARAAALLNGAAGVAAELNRRRFEPLHLERLRQQVREIEIHQTADVIEKYGIQPFLDGLGEPRLQVLARYTGWTDPLPGVVPARELSGRFEYVPRLRDQVERSRVEILRAIRGGGFLESARSWGLDVDALAAEVEAAAYCL